MQERARSRRKVRASRELDFHDGTIQLLYGVTLQLEMCLEQITESPPEISRALQKTISQLDGVIVNLRTRIYELEKEATAEPGGKG